LVNTTDGSGSVDYPGKVASFVQELEEFVAQIANNFEEGLLALHCRMQWFCRTLTLTLSDDYILEST